MTVDERYVVLGLAHVRSPWAAAVTRWSTAGSLPIELIKCLGVDELRARLAAGRLFSAALLDARLAAVDRDLLAALAGAEVPALVVETGGRHRDWTAIGAAATLPADLDRTALLDALVEHARLVDAVPPELAADAAGGRPVAAWRGRLVAVTGRPGCGRSTIAAAIAQRLAHDPRHAGDVVLADLCHRAHQAILHDARDVVPGVQELVEAHRTGAPSFEQVRDLCFDVPVRRYRLLLGLRRPRDWVTVRPRALGAALDGLRRSTRLVVADVDDDLDGEAETGSADLEDRNGMARTVVAAADLVVVVATPTVTGLHGLVGLLDDLRRFGVPGERTLVVLNRSPRTVRTRAELTRTVAELTGARERPDPHLGPVHVPERRSVEPVHRDLARLPAAVAEPAGLAVLDALDPLEVRTDEPAADEPVPIRPGELGHWSDPDADDDLPDAGVGP